MIKCLVPESDVIYGYTGVIHVAFNISTTHDQFTSSCMEFRRVISPGARVVYELSVDILVNVLVVSIVDNREVEPFIRNKADILRPEEIVD